MSTKLFVGSLLLVVACSAEPLASRDATSSPVGAAAGKSGSTQGAAGTPPLTGVENPTMIAQPMGVAGTGAAPSTPAMPAMPTRNIDPIAIDACKPGAAGSLSADEIQKLTAGAPAGKLRMLYPYDGTVFPRGMLPPTIMWDGLTGATALYIHIKGPRFEYKGCVVPTGPDQWALPADVWAAAGEKTFGSTDPYVVELTVLANGTVAGPVTAKWTVAQATIKGSIYYNSYSSKLSAPGGAAPAVPGFPGGGFPGGGFPGGGGSNGIVLRIPPGGKAEAFVSVQCNGCHSVSANGSRLISVVPGAGGQSYVLTQNSAANPAPMAAGASAAYGALYPDGTVYLSTSLAADVARASFLSAAGAATNATLFRTDDGTMIPSTGIPNGALMPNFSPDGSVLAFNDFAIKQAHGLAVMKYDNKTHTASDYKAVYMDDGSMRPGWPFVLPDNGGVLFARTDSVEFSGEGAGLALTAPGIPGPGAGGGPKSDLYIVDIASGTATLLAKAMGYVTPQDAAMEKTYLPFGAAELHKSYYPTLSPVAAGGYFWIFFDAVRNYGNLGVQRQLWGAAVEIAPDGKYTTDRSHPAFYVPGQEFGTGNHRAFAALDPCKKTGDTCTSGTDCCGGFCFVKDPMVEFAEPMGSCADERKECSNTNERCTIDADCCPPRPGQEANMCIAGFCAMLLRPI